MTSGKQSSVRARYVHDKQIRVINIGKFYAEWNGFKWLCFESRGYKFNMSNRFCHDKIFTFAEVILLIILFQVFFAPFQIICFLSCIVHVVQGECQWVLLTVLNSWASISSHTLWFINYDPWNLAHMKSCIQNQTLFVSFGMFLTCRRKRLQTKIVLQVQFQLSRD